MFYAWQMSPDWPLVPYMVIEKMILEKDSSMSVRPGITGLWQVSGRMMYILTSVLKWTFGMKNWSLWNDIILVRLSGDSY